MTSGVYFRTEKNKLALSEAGKKRSIVHLHTPEAIQKRIEKRKGLKMNSEWVKNLSISHLGQIAWNKGKTYQLGEKHWAWKSGISRDLVKRSWSKNKRNRMKRVISGTHSLEDWQELKKKCDFMCLSCKRFEPEIKLTEDHIIPVSKGGTDDISNIQPLCGSCNSKKYNKTINYFLETNLMSC